MEKGILIVRYVLEVVKYYIAYEVFFQERLKRYYVPAAGLLLYVSSLFLWWNRYRSFLAVLMYLVVFGTIVTVQKVSIWNRVKRGLVLLFFLSCADEFFARLLELLKIHTGESVGWEALVESFCTPLALVGAAILKRICEKGLKDSFPRYLKKISYLTVLLVSLTMLMTIAGFKATSEYLDSPILQNLANALCLFSYFGIEMTGVIIVYNRWVNEKMETLVENELLLQEMQKHYYEDLLVREEDTRRYRHDMANHLLCLDKIAEEGNLEKVQAYLREMNQEMQAIQKKTYHSGNDIIDVITNHYLKMLSPLTEIKFSGKIQIQVDEMKLCTIYGNLLQNAVEELKKCNIPSYLEIRLEQGNNFCRISLRNSLSEGSRDKADVHLLKTSKQDEKNHGLGLKNTLRAVEELNGVLELKKGEKDFNAVVILPL